MQGKKRNGFQELKSSPGHGDQDEEPLELPFVRVQVYDEKEETTTVDMAILLSTNRCK